MAEIRQVSKQKISWNKERGEYSGEAYTSLLGTKPEGYGTAVFESGMILDGRFKEGNFITGTAKMAGIIYQGDFYDLKWLGGANGRIDYPNGDYLVGAINPISKKLEVTELKYTQDFGDTLEGSHITNEYGRKVFFATQTYLNGSKVEGLFDPEYAPVQGVNYYNFGIRKEKYYCSKGKANIILHRDNRINATVSGEYTKTKDKPSAQIVGKYSFVNKITNTTITATGEFSYSREKHNSNTHDTVSEDFTHDLSNNNSLTGYDTNLTLLDGGKLEIQTPAGTFSATKKIIDDKVTYQGKMYAKNGSFSTEGIFDQNLNILDGKVLIKKEADTFSAILTEINTNCNQEYSLYSAKAHGNYSQLHMHREGNFTVNFETEKDPAGIVVEASLSAEPTFINGKIKQYLPTGEIFDGELYSQKQKEDASIKLPHLNLNEQDTLYFGTYKQKADSGELIFSETGFFADGYEFICGQITRSNIMDTGLNFNGKFDMQRGYEGRLENPLNGDYHEGTFDTQLKFLAGKLRETYPNQAIFEGQTADCHYAQGVLERKEHFCHKGSFEFNSDEYPILTKGEVVVHFDTPDHTYCRAHYDRKGFELFDGKTYICNFKSDTQPDGVAVADYDITDAFAKFVDYTSDKILTSTQVAEAEAQLVLSKDDADQSPMAEEILSKYQEQKTQATDETTQPQKTDIQPMQSTIYTDSVEFANGIISNLDAQTQPYDISTAQSIMSKLTNPNKSSQQSKDE